MRVLSLCDGHATGLAALKSEGIKVDKYYAAETDKYASAVARFNHPEIEHLGDVEKIEVGALGKIDLVLAGPPCQGFSCSGSRLDFEDPRSKLFFKAIEILWDIQQTRPGVKFLIENVSSMRKNIQDQLTELIGVEPIRINSNLVSAQNRDRLYWTNIESSGPPKDEGIFLKDILESNVDDKYYLHKNSISGKSTLRRLVDSLRNEDEKSKSLLSEQGFTKIGNTCLIMPVGKRSLKHLVDGLKFGDEKSRALTASAARNISGSNSTCLVIQTPRGKNPGGIRAIDGKTPTLSANSWENNNHLLELADVEHLFEMIRKNGDEKTFIKVSKKLSRKPDQKKASCLTGGGKAAGDHSAMDYILYNDFSFRRFTPVECELLQTMVKNYTEFGRFEPGTTKKPFDIKKISNFQRYKMTGNGWTLKVITNFLKGLKQ